MPTEMNNLDLLKTKICNEDNYNFGISSLHCWIRFFECILHIANKLPIERRSAYTNEHKQKVQERKNTNTTRIQKKERLVCLSKIGSIIILLFWKGLTIDKVRAGAGTSNDGNTARRFFAGINF